MTQNEKIEKLKMMCDETDESILLTYLELAEGKVLAQAFPYDSSVTTVPTRLETIALEITCYMLNKRGAEGESRHSENGIDRTYDCGDIPTSLLRKIIPSVGVF